MPLPISSNDQQLNDHLLPRRYQEEVFEKAQKGNVIAALSTGSGKTLISLLLIKWIASQEASLGKLIIFLVPMITLVQQQAEYISTRTTLRVTKLHGSQSRDLSDRPGWAKFFQSSDILVVTAQVFLNLLTHGLWSIDKVSLMIFDECHHARKNHAYNAIMREYFEVNPPHRRPKVFGMTASPVWNIKNPAQSIQMLESNLDAKIISVVEHAEELLQHSSKTNELIREYPFPPETFNYPSPTIFQCLKTIDEMVWDKLDVIWSSVEVRYFTTLSNLGPYCASLFLYWEIQHYVDTILAEHRSQRMDVSADSNGMSDVIPSSIPGSKSLPHDIHLVLDILGDFQAFFPSTVPISLDWCSPKIRTLVDILLEYHTPKFQGIIFVEQRQVASTLSQTLQVIPELSGKIRCGFLVGGGTDHKYSTGQVGYHDPVKQFRDGAINILIATSVAEEGLDFPACDLVVRFDPLQHMIGYVQSRGRARNKASTFIVLIQKDDIAQREKYRKLQEKEPEFNQIYQTRHLRDNEDDDDDEADVNPLDLVKRERYVIPSTGASLTYDNSLNLLNYLCSLIPRDAFTPAHVPKFTGDFQATLHLPQALPLDPLHLTYVGPQRQSKMEARRAVAFMAVVRLQKLDVFDEYLLPVAKHEEDIESGSKLLNASNVPDNSPLIATPVRDPWCIGPKLWMHLIMINDDAVAGLITGTSLPVNRIKIAGLEVAIRAGEILDFSEDFEEEEINDMKQFTTLGIRYNSTSSPLPISPSFFLVPLTPDRRPDFEAMRRLLDNPRGTNDWSQISTDHYDKLIVLNCNRFGSTYLLRRICHDLTPLSSPPPGSREDGHPTYHDYWLTKWARKTRPAVVPPIGPLLETTLLPRSYMLQSYTLLDSIQNSGSLPVHSACDGRILPQSTCVWLPISYQMRQAFEILPTLCHHITNIYRARCAKFELGLPLIPYNLMIEAFTIPSAALSFNNQRMETLGDAVLQLCTTVHLLNKYPNRHEGQLTTLRKLTVSNDYLRLRALHVGLERFVNSEGPSNYRWRYTLPDMIHPDSGVNAVPQRSVTREYAQRSLQDCMEAILAASYIAGGIPLALQTGTALGLEFGGSVPWSIRYSHDRRSTPVAPLFAGLEDNLGYKFRDNRILVESLTHPSFAYSDGPSYQRLEFLGDAILDLVVLRYMYDKFPKATSHQLALPRTKAICSPTLANVAVRRLDLHKMMLANSVELNKAIDHYVPLLREISGEDIVKSGWKFDPPKALSDVFESLIGAVLVDSGYNYEKTAAVVEHVMADVLEALSPDVDKDPVSEVMEWMASFGCNVISFEKTMKKTSLWERRGIEVLVHGQVVVGPIVATSLTVAKFLAAQRALAILKDPDSKNSLKNLCGCATALKSTNQLEQLNEATLTADPLTNFTGDDRNPSDSEDIQEVADILNQVEGMMIE